MSYTPRPASTLGTFHTRVGLLGLGFCSQDSPLHWCPRCLVSCTLNKGSISVPKTKGLTHPVPQDHKSGKTGIVPLASTPPGRKTCLKAWPKSQDKRMRLQRSKHPPQGMRVQVPSPWWPLIGAPQLERKGQDRDGPNAIQKVSGPVMGTPSTQGPLAVCWLFFS